jgi:hypothetical protein
MHLPTVGRSNSASPVASSINARGGGSYEATQWEVGLLDRTTRKSITFSRPFELAGVDEKFDAGTYEVETVEELIEGLSFVAYRRVATTIVMPAKILGSFARQVLTIDPKDLEVAIAADSQSGCSTSIEATS